MPTKPATKIKGPTASDLGKMFAEANLSDDVPKLYFNGFTNVQGGSDVSIMLRRHNHVVAILNTSFTLAKTLGLRLTELIQALEAATGTEIMISDTIDKRLAEAEKKKPASPSGRSTGDSTKGH